MMSPMYAERTPCGEGEGYDGGTEEDPDGEAGAALRLRFLIVGFEIAVGLLWRCLISTFLRRKGLHHDFLCLLWGKAWRQQRKFRLKTRLAQRLR